MGFVALENPCGDEKTLYCAELLTCLDKKAWGSFSRYGAKVFLKKCFEELGIYKIKALVFPDNFRVSTLLKTSGFRYETTLKAETLRMGKPQDIDVYAVYSK